MSGIYGNSQEDRYFERMLDKHLSACDASGERIEARIEELKSEYLDDDDQIFDILISEEWVGDVQSTIRAMVNAYLLKREDSFNAFAKSIAQSIVEGVEKKATFYAESEM